MARSRADRFAEVLSLLEKTWGAVPRVDSDRAMDQLAAFSLARNAPAANAVKAVAAIGKRFVDFNELRLSRVREIAPPLKSAGIPQPELRARELVGILDSLYRERNEAGLTFLERMEAEEAYAFLQTIEGLDDGIAAALASRRLEPGKVLALTDLLRVPSRIGFAGKGATPAKVRKVLEDQSKKKGERFRMHYLFALHAAKVCRSRSPFCADCALNEVCDYGKAALKGSSSSSKRNGAASKAKGSTASGTKAPAKKGAAAKKAAPKKAAAKKPKPAKAATRKSAAKKPAAKKPASSKKAPARKSKKAASGPGAKGAGTAKKKGK